MSVFVHHTFPGIDGITTVVSDGEKRFIKGLQLVFGEHVSYQVACLKLRTWILQRHGSTSVSVFYRLTNAKTLEAIASVRSSADFCALSDVSKAALNAILDEKHFPRCCGSHRSDNVRKDSLSGR